jgi:hypothetical protein
VVEQAVPKEQIKEMMEQRLQRINPDTERHTQAEQGRLFEEVVNLVYEEDAMVNPEDRDTLILAFVAGQLLEGICYAELAARMTNPVIFPRKSGHKDKPYRVYLIEAWS